MRHHPELAHGVGDRGAAPLPSACSEAPVVHDAVAARSSMTEFVALVALGVLVVGLGVLAAASLLTTVGWLVVRGVRRSRLARHGTDGGEKRPTGAIEA